MGKNLKTLEIFTQSSPVHTRCCQIHSHVRKTLMRGLKMFKLHTNLPVIGIHCTNTGMTLTDRIYPAASLAAS